MHFVELLSPDGCDRVLLSVDNTLAQALEKFRERHRGRSSTQSGDHAQRHLVRHGANLHAFQIGWCLNHGLGGGQGAGAKEVVVDNPEAALFEKALAPGLSEFRIVEDFAQLSPTLVHVACRVDIEFRHRVGQQRIGRHGHFHAAATDQAKELAVVPQLGRGENLDLHAPFGVLGHQSGELLRALVRRVLG